MTRKQKQKILNILNFCDTEIHNIFALDFIVQEWANCQDLQEALEDLDYTDLQKMFGKEVAEAIATDDEPIWYLNQRGGVFIKAGIRLLENIYFHEDGSFMGAGLSGYYRIIGVWGKDYDAAFCKLAATCNILHNREIKRVREAQGYGNGRTGA